MTNARLLILLATLALGYAAWVWLTYVMTYRAGQEEAAARLLVNGADKLRARLLQEEGITHDA